MQDGDVPDVSSLGWLGDEPAGAWVGLAADRDDPLFPVDVADSHPGWPRCWSEEPRSWVAHDG